MTSLVHNEAKTGFLWCEMERDTQLFGLEYVFSTVKTELDSVLQFSIFCEIEYYELRSSHGELRGA